MNVLEAAEVLTLAEEALDRLTPEQVAEGQKLLPSIVEAWAQLAVAAGEDEVAGMARARDALLGRLDGYDGAERLALIRIERIVGHIELARLRIRALGRRPAGERRQGAREELATLAAWGVELRREPEALTAAAQARLEEVVRQAWAVVGAAE